MYNKIIQYYVISECIMDLRQSIPITSIRNARELGGYMTADGRKIRSGVLLRTASLNGISDADSHLLTDTYRLQYIIDFRMPMEMVNAEDPPISGASYHHLDVIDMNDFLPQDDPVIDFSQTDLIRMVELSEQAGMVNEYMYIGFLTSAFGRKAFAEFFRFLLSADPERAVLWHCTSGKDRTGLAAMLTLSALGVEESVIIEDYLLTNQFNAQRIAQTSQYLEMKGCDEAFIQKAVLMFDAVDERYMRNAIAHLKKEYGSVAGYIREGLCVSQSDIAALREKYLN